jgi:Mce-associated membrane protein
MTDDAVTATPQDAAGGPTAPSDGPSEPSARRAGLVLAVTLAVVGAVVAAALGLVLAARDTGDPRSDAVRSAAGTFGAALVTYDYREPDVHRDRVLELATGSFRSEYEDAFDQGLAEIITEVEAVSEGFVDDVYVSAIDEERAEAIVVVDIEHQGSGGARSLADVYFLLALVEVDGTWKVDQVTDLNFDAAGGDAGSTDPASPGAPDPTTTSVP